MRPDGTPKICIPDAVLGHCSRPYHSTTQYQQGGPHDQKASLIDQNHGKMNGFVTSVTRGKGKCATAAYRFTAACRPFLGPKKQPDVLSYHTGKEIPNYWAYAKHYVLQDRMFAPADSWTLPSHLFLFSGWSAYCPDTSDPMSCRSNIDLSGRHQQYRYTHPPIYAWTDITYLLGKAGVSWNVYMGKGTCVQEPCTQKPGPYGVTLSSKSPLPGFVDVVQHDRLDHFTTHEAFIRQAEAGTLPSVSWIMPGNLASEHPGIGNADPKRAGLRDQARQLGDARPELGLLGHLPHLGRLGRLLRPRQTPEGRPQRIRAPRAGHRDQSVGEARDRSPNPVVRRLPQADRGSFPGRSASRSEDRRPTRSPSDGTGERARSSATSCASSTSRSGRCRP